MQIKQILFYLFSITCADIIRPIGDDTRRVLTGSGFTERPWHLALILCSILFAFYVIFKNRNNQ